MVAGKDFEVLFSNDPGKIRANANLPGELIFPITRLINHAEYLEQIRAALEQAYPGYDVAGGPGRWCWKDWGIPEGMNPVRDLITPYLQLSRSEAMKGSEQVVRSFQGVGAQEMDGVGVAPDLRPRSRPDDGHRTMIVVATDGVKQSKEVKSLGKRLIGLGGK